MQLVRHKIEKIDYVYVQIFSCVNKTVLLLTMVGINLLKVCSFVEISLEYCTVVLHCYINRETEIVTRSEECFFPY